MELVNELYKYKQLDNVNMPLLDRAVKSMILVLSPFTPHICEELWSELGEESRMFEAAWPEFDESALVLDGYERDPDRGDGSMRAARRVPGFVAGMQCCIHSPSLREPDAAL